MKTSTGALTKSQKRRFDAMYSLGCIACRIAGHGFEPAQIHHILSGGKRIGHDATIGLCPWHHVGETSFGMPAHEMQAKRGPSMFGKKRAFVEIYGTEAELLAMTNELLQKERRVWTD